MVLSGHAVPPIIIALRDFGDPNDAHLEGK